MLPAKGFLTKPDQTIGRGSGVYALAHLGLSSLETTQQQGAWPTMTMKGGSHCLKKMKPFEPKEKVTLACK